MPVQCVFLYTLFLTPPPPNNVFFFRNTLLYVCTGHKIDFYAQCVKNNHLSVLQFSAVYIIHFRSTFLIVYHCTYLQIRVHCKSLFVQQYTYVITDLYNDELEPYSSVHCTVYTISQCKIVYTMAPYSSSLYCVQCTPFPECTVVYSDPRFHAKTTIVGQRLTRRVLDIHI